MGKHRVTLEVDTDRDEHGNEWGANFTAPRHHDDEIGDYAGALTAWDRPPFTRVLSVEPEPRGEAGTPERAAAFGGRAVEVGSPDRGQNDDRTDAIDTITNVLHWLGSRGEGDPAACLSSAAAHYFAECERGEGDPA
jgi:hypothetical protein